MDVIYFANVGTRDVQRNGAPLAKPRRDGEALLRDYLALKGELGAPILTSGIKLVLETAPAIDRVQLFVTDQPAPPDTSEYHWERDTVAFGEVLRRLISERFGERVRRVEYEPLRFNPSNYDRTLRFFADRLPLLVPTGGVEAAYVAPVGGVDACNVGLTINAVRTYREKCQFIYVAEQGPAQVLDLHRELLGDYARQEAGAHLERHDYAALRSVLERAGLGRRWHLSLCDYADRRLRFDFRRADAALVEALAAADGGEARLRLGQLRNSVQPFLARNPQPASADGSAAWESWLDLQRLRLGELYFNLRLKARRSEWVDFLGRLFRLDEGMLRFAFEAETRHSTDGAERRGYPDFAKALDALGLAKIVVPQFAKLAASRGRETVLREARPTTYNLGQVVQHWAKTGKRPIPVAVAGVRDVFQKLSTLRNKSIIAHGYEGVSEEDVRSELPGSSPEGLVARLGAVLQQLGVKVAEDADPFAAAQELLRGAL
jgi:hypothetical protein